MSARRRTGLRAQWVMAVGTLLATTVWAASLSRAAGQVPHEEVHPLLSSLSPPEWLAGRDALTLVRAAARDPSVEARFASALGRAVAPDVAATRAREVVSPDTSLEALIAAAGEAGHDTVVGVTLRLTQQVVHLRVLYLDLRAQPPRQHVAESSAPLDAFLRRVVGGPPAARSGEVRTRTLRFEADAVLGLEVADIDGDGRAELLVAREPHLSVYALVEDGGRLQVVRRGRARWPQAALRVPFARRTEAWFSEQAGRVVVARSDREGEWALTLRGDALSFESVTSACPGGQRYPDGCARWVAGRDYFGGALEPLGPVQRATLGLAGPASGGDDDEAADEDDTRARSPRFYSRLVRALRQADGRALAFDVLVTPRGSLVAQVAGARAAVGGQGAALAAADVDADGALDVLTSDSAPAGQDDRLRWFRVASDGRLVLFWEGASTPGAVSHAAAGDLLGTGRPLFIAFEARSGGGARLWVVD